MRIELESNAPRPAATRSPHRRQVKSPSRRGQPPSRQGRQ
jgi:hypothetical protein